MAPKSPECKNPCDPGHDSGNQGLPGLFFFRGAVLHFSNSLVCIAQFFIELARDARHHFVGGCRHFGVENRPGDGKEHGGLRDHRGGRSLRIIEKGHLAEHHSGPHPRDLLVADADDKFAGYDQVKFVAAFSFLENSRPRLKSFALAKLQKLADFHFLYIG